MMKPTNDSDFIVYDLAAFQQDDKTGLLGVLGFLYYEDSDLEMPSWERYEFGYRRLVIASFIKKEIHSKFKMKELNRRWTKAVDPEVELWRKTLTMLERLHTLGFLPYPHPAIAFLGLIREKGLLLSNLLDEYSIEGINGKKDFIAKIQGQNRQIQTYENPFDANEYPHTSQILKIAQKVAQESDQFKKGQFNPVYRARMTLIARLNASTGEMRRKGKIVRHRRRTKN